MKPKIQDVVIAIFYKDDRIFCAQRNESGKLPLKWEFPGGKVETTESPEYALRREIKEELGCEIDLIDSLPSFTHVYDFGTCRIFPYFCKFRTEDFELYVHQAYRWIAVDEMRVMDFVEADYLIIDDIKNYVMGK